MHSPTRTCPACGAALSTSSIICEYCGSRVVPVALSFQEREEVNRLVKRLNASLDAEKNALLRRVETISAAVWLFGSLLLFLFWLPFALLDRGWVYIIIFSLLCLGFRVVLRRRWASNRFIRIYRTEIEPQIRQFTQEAGLPRWQFDQMASFVIDDDAALRRFLKVKPAADKIIRKKGDKT